VTVRLPLAGAAGHDPLVYVPASRRRWPASSIIVASTRDERTAEAWALALRRELARQGATVELWIARDASASSREDTPADRMLWLDSPSATWVEALPSPPTQAGRWLLGSGVLLAAACTPGLLVVIDPIAPAFAPLATARRTSRDSHESTLPMSKLVASLAARADLVLTGERSTLPTRLAEELVARAATTVPGGHRPNAL
jgi:hypothetical protein